MAPVLLNVRLPATRDAAAPHLTRFQAAEAPNWAGTMLLGLEVSPSDTVAALKRKVAERAGGVVPEMLRKGGGGGQGVVLQDSQTLAECGLDYTMGMWEYLWVDSAANQAEYKAEYEKVCTYVTTQRDFLNSRPQ